LDNPAGGQSIKTVNKTLMPQQHLTVSRKIQMHSAPPNRSQPISWLLAAVPTHVESLVMAIRRARAVFPKKVEKQFFRNRMRASVARYPMTNLILPREARLCGFGNS
jgi:hypothetical protein